MNKSLLSASRVITIISGVFLCFGIITIPLAVLNFIAAGKIKDLMDGANNKEQVRSWCIYLIFTTFYFLGGILGLIGLGSDQKNQNSSSDLESKLNELNRLYDRGLIDKEEYDERRRKLIFGE